MSDPHRGRPGTPSPGSLLSETPVKKVKPDETLERGNSEPFTQ